MIFQTFKWLRHEPVQEDGTGPSPPTGEVRVKHTMHLLRLCSLAPRRFGSAEGRVPVRVEAHRERC